MRRKGVLLFADGEMQLYDEQQQPLPVAEPGEESFSWTQRIFHATYNSMKMRGSQVVSIFQTYPQLWIRNIVVGHGVLITIMVISDGGTGECGIIEDFYSPWSVAER